ncbi:hypothetical protein KIPB_013334, partial [Kipferlia bialata]
VTSLLSLGVSADALPPSPTPLELTPFLPLVVAELALLKEGRGVSKHFSSFSPASLPVVQALIERAQAFDTQELSTHISRLSQYLPLAKALSPLLASVQCFLRQHPRDKLPTEPCPPLLSTLTSGHTALHTAYQGVRALDFDPAESVAYLTKTLELLDSINRACPIALPEPSTLTLVQKRQYFQVEEYNGLVEEYNGLVRKLYTIAGKVSMQQFY